MKYLAMTSTFASELRVGSPNGWCGNRALPARSQRGLAVQERFSPVLRVPPPRHAASSREAALGSEDPVVVLAVVRAGRLCLPGAGCPEDRPGRARAAVVSAQRGREAALAGAPRGRRRAPRRYQGVWQPLGPAAAAGPRRVGEGGEIRCLGLA